MNNKITRKFTLTLIILVLVLACSSTAQPIATNAPVNTVEISSSTATPSVLTCEQVQAVTYDNKLTSAQVDAYIESIKGKQFQFSGVVDDVLPTLAGEYQVFVDIKSCNRIYLLGIPKEVALTLNKGQPVSGTGTVSQEFQRNLKISVNVTEFNH